MAKYQKFLSLVVDSNPAVADLLEGASEAKQGERMRRSDEVARILQFVFMGSNLTNIPLRSHSNEKVDQATVSRLSSASDGPGFVLFDKEAGYPGNFIALLEFQAQLDDAAVLSGFHRNT